MFIVSLPACAYWLCMPSIVCMVVWRNILGVAFYGSDLAASSLPIATSLCPDETDNCGDEDQLALSLFLAVLVFHPDIYSKEEARDGLSELRSMYLVAHFPQKQDIYQFKWQAMKFVERGGTTRRNRPQCACFENHSASSHLPYNLPPLVNLGDSTQSWRVQDAHSGSILGPVFANCGFSAACAPHYSGVGGSHQPSWLLSVLPSLNDDDGDVKRSFRKVRSPT